RDRRGDDRARPRRRPAGEIRRRLAGGGEAEPRGVPRGAGGATERRSDGAAGGRPVAPSPRRPVGVTMPRHVVLVGLPGAGKSTAGRLAAEKLGAPFLDPDTLIVRRMQMPVSRIFAE